MYDVLYTGETNNECCTCVCSFYMNRREVSNGQFVCISTNFMGYMLLHTNTCTG